MVARLQSTSQKASLISSTPTHTHRAIQAATGSSPCATNGTDVAQATPAEWHGRETWQSEQREAVACRGAQ